MRRLFLIVILMLSASLILPTCGSEDAENSNGDDDDDDNDNNNDDNDNNNDNNDDDNNNDEDSDNVCAESDFQISSKMVDMLIVLDRSNSMRDDQLWNPMGSALTEVTAATETNVNFGLAVFPSQECAGSNACVSGEVIVDIAPMNGATVASLVGGGSADIRTCGGTPIAATLELAKEYLDGTEGDLEKFVLLATDGAPNCNDALDEETCTCTDNSTNCPGPTYCLDDEASEAAAAALKEAGYLVYVLGIGGSANWAEVMDNIAAAGGTDTHISAETGDFTDVLLDIIGGVMSCEFDIDWESIPEADNDPEQVNFYCKPSADAENEEEYLIGFDKDCAAGKGWDWVDENYDRVIFCEEACNKIKNGECPNISATFGCPTDPIIVD